MTDRTDTLDAALRYVEQLKAQAAMQMAAWRIASPAVTPGCESIDAGESWMDGVILSAYAVMRGADLEVLRPLAIVEPYWSYNGYNGADDIHEALLHAVADVLMRHLGMGSAS